MKQLAQFGQFWYDFIVGDDWTIALAVVVSLVVVAVTAQAGLQLWWLLPLAVAVMLTLSVQRVAATAKK